MGANIVRGTARRLAVPSPAEWGHAIGTDYHAFFGEADEAASGGKDLVGDGWETNGFGYLAASGANFLDVDNQGTMGGFNFDVASDYLISPFIFGSYCRGRFMQDLFGYFPTTLTMEVMAYFASTAADEQATGFGFVEAGSGGGVLAKADLMAFISVGATNFELHSGAAADEGSAKDTSPHVFKIVITFGGSAEWFIDDVSQGTIAIQSALWPVAWAANTQAGGNNDPVVCWVDIEYN